MDPIDENLPETQAPAVAEPIAYPPKFRKPDQPTNAWLRSITSLALYLALGYLFFNQWEVLLVITAIVMIHEFGHFFAMKFFGYSDLGIFFIPLLGAYVSGTKREVSQKQSAIILMAGPLPGILIGMTLFLIDQQSPGHRLLEMSYTRVGLLFIILNAINLLPIYPLDGGQLLNRVFLDEDSLISKLFIYASIGLLGWFAISNYLATHNTFYFILLVFPLMMLYRLVGDKKLTGIEQKIEEDGIHLDVDYDQLPDADYWKIRNILIAEHSSFKEVKPTPPFEFDVKEERIMSTIQSLLHRHVIQDLSIAGKAVIAVIWVAAFFGPWWLHMYDFIKLGYLPA